jgi:hypothetical protein
MAFRWVYATKKLTLSDPRWFTRLETPTLSDP